MQSPDVVILTDARYETLDADNWYHAQIWREEGLLLDALLARGLRAERVAWSAPHFDWSRVRAAVFRSTWDYFHRYAEFCTWMDRVSRVTRLVNSATLVRWNVDKHYLGDLSQRGVSIPPTQFLEPGENATLCELLSASGWDEAILKPAVSGAARHTYRLNRENCSAHEDVFRDLIRNESMLLQPFLGAVLTHGEISLMVIDGHCTHAVRKVAKPGDFRVQDDHGGTVHPHVPTPDEIAFAEQAVAACPEKPLYARVDVVRFDDGRLALMELEIVEPELFLRFHPPAAESLASAIAAAL